MQWYTCFFFFLFFSGLCTRVRYSRSFSSCRRTKDSFDRFWVLLFWVHLIDLTALICILNCNWSCLPFIYQTILAAFTLLILVFSLNFSTYFAALQGIFFRTCKYIMYWDVVQCLIALNLIFPWRKTDMNAVNSQMMNGIWHKKDISEVWPNSVLKQFKHSYPSLILTLVISCLLHLYMFRYTVCFFFKVVIL